MSEQNPGTVVSPEEARQIAEHLYGLQVAAKPLPGYDDANFRLKTRSGARFLLKVSAPETEIEYLKYQTELLQKVHQSLPGFATPIPLPSLGGKAVAAYRDREGRTRWVRLLSWLEGRPWTGARPRTPELLTELGRAAGTITRILAGFDHSQAHRSFEWDLAKAGWTRESLHHFSEEEQELLSYFQERFIAFREDYEKLRQGVVHNDVNDHNILLTQDLTSPRIAGIIDFGDAVHTQVINDVAITIAYAVMGLPDPLEATCQVLKGYHERFPLQEEELPFLFTLIGMRLVISVTKAAQSRQSNPENRYLTISEQPAWDLLRAWQEVDEEYAHYSFREACGFPPYPREKAFAAWAKQHPRSLTDLFPSLGRTTVLPLDLSVASTWLGHETEFNDLDRFDFKLARLQREAPEAIIAGGYQEPRPIYISSAYDKIGNSGPESRTIHLGIDFWLPAGTPVHALFEGEIVTAANDAGNKAYGGLIIVKHRVGGFEFFTLYGHLSLASIAQWQEGDPVPPGACLGWLGDRQENGNWSPHLHFQVMLSRLNYVDDFPGVAFADQRFVWRSLCPNPNLFFNLPELEPRPLPAATSLLEFREQHLGKGLSLSYRKPLHIVRGAGVWLVDALGKKYLDTVNNVAHVGHEHPKVVEAGQRQMAVLNTNTRYLHPLINRFAEALLATFPEPLSVVHFVNSGSEANELALRMARTCTGQRDMIALDMGYHGNTGACVDVSAYKFDGPGGQGAPEHTHLVPVPDTFRGLYRGPEAAGQYASHIRQQVENLKGADRGIAGFIHESIVSCGGQIELPADYLREAYATVRKAGGLCIADEVQTGVGRVGSQWWAFQLHGVVPDIVTIGKPLGNGHPVAAVVCTPAVADAFANGMEFFNTFGGNPVSCAIGLEVLKVVEEAGLRQQALDVGNFLKNGLRELRQEFPIIGDVRGQGLFLGFELNGPGLEPLGEAASYLANRMRERGILMSTDGKDHNVLKIKPPMVFSRAHAERLLDELRLVLQEDYFKTG